MPKLGTVIRLRRYPVKSMKGEDLSEATFFENGILGDRLYAFNDIEGEKGRGFPWPWITARQVPELLFYEPRFKSDDIKNLEFFRDGSRIEAGSIEEFVRIKYGLKIKLKYDENGNHDSKPVSLLGMDTIEKLERESIKLEPERFRENIYVRWDNKKPFYEDELVGRVINLGSLVSLRVLSKNSRCEIPTLSPETAKASRIVLENISKKHRGRTGVYASVESKGSVSVGDEISG